VETKFSEHDEMMTIYERDCKGDRTCKTDVLKSTQTIRRGAV